MKNRISLMNRPQKYLLSVSSLTMVCHILNNLIHTRCQKSCVTRFYTKLERLVSELFQENGLPC